MQDKYKYALSGALAGGLNGLLGAGGGIILVPLLLKYIGLKPKMAFATSVFIILPISAVSATVYLIGGRVDFSLALPYLIGGAVGAVICGLKYKNISALLLRRIFGALLIFGGVRAVFFG